MPVVVTGAAGFVGRALVGDLADRGYRVVAVDRRPMPGLPPGVAALRADLTAPGPEAETALRGAEAVFHLAGRPGVRDTDPNANLYRHRDNVLATARVLDLVPAATPLVVTSSSSVYGECRGRAAAEDGPLAPMGGYARSKAVVERLCAARLAAGGAVAVARPFTVAGEGQRPDMALARWIEAVRLGDPIRILGSPGRSRDVTDVRQVARSLRLMAERGVHGPLNVGTGRPRTLAELAAAVCRTAGRPAEIVVVPAEAAEPASTRADPTRHERLLGFRPHTDLDALVARQMAAATPPELAAAAP